MSTSIERIVQAFRADGYSVSETEDVFRYQDGFGVRATSPATIGATGKNKQVFFVEGSPYQLGYLTASMAPSQLSAMAVDFTREVVLDFVHEGLGDRLPVVGAILKKLVLLVQREEQAMTAIPDYLMDEMRGLLDGYHKACSGVAGLACKEVTLDDLLVLNLGVDVLLACVYPLELPKVFEKLTTDEQREIRRAFAKSSGAVLPLLIRRLGLRGPLQTERERRFRIPYFCNAFSAKRSATSDGTSHFFGRDFMFTTSGIFNVCATMMIRSPKGLTGHQPTLSVTAPGFVGSVTAMNPAGVVCGVDMVASAACNPDHPGLNSLLLVRDGIEMQSSGAALAQHIIDAPRGVSWLYPFADGTHDQAGVVEATGVTTGLSPTSFPPLLLRCLLPSKGYLDQNPSGTLERGAMVRKSDWPGQTNADKYWARFNPRLFELFGKHYSSTAMGPKGFIDATDKEKNCPHAFYFPPQREACPDLLIATNFYLSPELALTSMGWEPALLSSGEQDDLQYRYDQLNLKLTTLIEEGGVDWDSALQVLKFRDPNPADPEKIIEGALSLLELKTLRITSHYGFYGDAWVELDFSRYVAAIAEG